MKITFRQFSGVLRDLGYKKSKGQHPEVAQGQLFWRFQHKTKNRSFFIPFYEAKDVVDNLHILIALQDIQKEFNFVEYLLKKQIKRLKKRLQMKEGPWEFRRI